MIMGQTSKMENVIQTTFFKGLDLHKTKKFSRAKILYDETIKLAPKHSDANHNLGIIYIEQGDVLQAIPLLRIALEIDPNNLQYWISYIDALIRLGKIEDAKNMLQQAREREFKAEAFDELEQRIPDIKKATQENSNHNHNRKPSQTVESSKRNPPPELIDRLLNLYDKGQLFKVIEQAQEIIKQCPEAFMVWNILGAANKGLGLIDEASKAFKKVTELDTQYAEGYSNLGVCLQRQGKLVKAIEAHNKALTLQPSNATFHYNLGNVFKKQGQLDEAIEAYKNALSLQPDNSQTYLSLGNTFQNRGDLAMAIKTYNQALLIQADYPEVYNNLGNAFKLQGQLDKAIAAYKKGTLLDPNYAEAFYNLGLAHQELGQLDAAIEAFKKALTIKPTFAEAHRHLSILVKHKPEDPIIKIVERLLEQPELNYADKCRLYYTVAKMKEDIGDFGTAYDYYVAGGELRKKLLSYNIRQDQLLFAQIKSTAPTFKNLSLNLPDEVIDYRPIFILGMPRSGTTLIEQILSCHSQIHGAGELSLLGHLGGKLNLGIQDINQENLLRFRTAYLTEIGQKAGKKKYVTDKTPQNFRYIGLLLKTLPEAKIIHVKRAPSATCWSNFKYYFSSNGLGYSYDLKDTVKYYKLYQDLMDFWNKSYRNQIFELDYDKLTIEQDYQTRRLIEFLGLDWEATCLSPQKNKRIVMTTSQLQIREKVYTGSSQAWRKFEPYLNGAFDRFASKCLAPRKAKVSKG